MNCIVRQSNWKALLTQLQATKYFKHSSTRNTAGCSSTVIPASKFHQYTFTKMASQKSVLNNYNNKISSGGILSLPKANNARTVNGIIEQIISRETENTMEDQAFSKPKQPFTIIVEGNIGSGKTTFLKHFKKFSQVCVVDEPVEKWRDAQGHNLFDLMYKDPVKWSFCFQSYVQLTMLDLHTKPTPQAVKLMERSIFSAKYCFVNNLRDQGLLADVEYTVLTEWFNFIRETVPIKVDLIVYLRTDPETVFERISQRGRPEENGISLEYLKSIHNLHEDWLQNKTQFLPCPVITIDANDDLASMVKNYKSCEETIFQKAAVAN